MSDLWKDGLGILAVLVLVLMNGFFVAAEFALVSVRRTRIEQLANEGSRAAKGVEKALAHLDTYIAATQLGITMASLALGFVGEPTIAHLIEPLFATFLPVNSAMITAHGVAVTLAFAIATALHIVFGELAPKSIALQRPDRTSLWVTAPLNIFLAVFRPFIVVLNATGNGVVSVMGIKPVSGHGAIHSVEELELLVHSTMEAGLLEEHQERMVTGVFDFRETMARKIMTPRLDITAVEADATLEALFRIATESGHSRFPVYDDNLDNIVGVLHVKDVLPYFGQQETPNPIRACMRTPYYVPENKRGDALLAEMRRDKLQMVIVRDEYGTVTGVVTIEDLIEEIVGDILDEYDIEEPMVQVVDAMTYVLGGKMELHDVNERLGLELPEDEADTIGGFVFGLLGHQAQQGERTQWENASFSVEATDGRRITSVRVVRHPVQQENDADETFHTSTKTEPSSILHG